MDLSLTLNSLCSIFISISQLCFNEYYSVSKGQSVIFVLYLCLFLCLSVICLCKITPSLFLRSSIYCINCVHLNRALDLIITPAVFGFTRNLSKAVLQNYTHTHTASHSMVYSAESCGLFCSYKPRC